MSRDHITRTVTLDDIKPAELAVMFANMDSREQIEFFGEVGRIALDWSGAGWCQQSSMIVRDLHLDHHAQSTIAALAEHYAEAFPMEAA